MNTRAVSLCLAAGLVGLTGCDSGIEKHAMKEAKAPGMERYDYLACDGGPHILLPRMVSGKWNGHKIRLANPLPDG